MLSVTPSSFEDAVINWKCLQYSVLLYDCFSCSTDFSKLIRVYVKCLETDDSRQVFHCIFVRIPMPHLSENLDKKDKEHFFGKTKSWKFNKKLFEAWSRKKWRGSWSFFCFFGFFIKLDISTLISLLCLLSNRNRFTSCTTK